MSGRLVLVDADMLAGWRRASSSLAQLHQAVLHLERQHPEAQVTVVADPALKWSLDSGEQPAFEADIVAGVVVCAPAGTMEGASGFLARVAERAVAGGADVVAVTDRAVPGVALARVACDAGRWSFDLDGALPVTADRRPTATSSRRPRTRGTESGNDTPADGPATADGSASRRRRGSEGREAGSSGPG